MNRVVFAALLAACSSPGDGGAVDQPDGGSPDVSIMELEPGLRGEYFARYHERVVERVDLAIDFAWGDGELAPDAGADRVSVRWTGFLDVPVAGSYTFITSNDDGVRVRVGDTLVIDDWNFHFPERHEGTVELAAGPVPIVVEYFEIDLTAEMRLSWSSPDTGLVEEIIPTERLRAAPAPAPAEAIAVKPPYVNPVLDRDCPDPGVTFAGDAFYMVCTGGSFPIRRSPDLVMWEATGTSVLPGGKAPWSANGGRNWAPEIHQVGNKFVAYFTAVNSANVLSIGAASSDSIEGPYTDRGGPLSQHALGVIDPSFFRDTDGTPYLTYKIDGNSVGQPTPIYIRKLTADGLSFAATPIEILRNSTSTWEGGVIEAQWIVKHDGMYYLFYSGNVYDHRYRTGVARASKVTGPYTKKGAPILTNNARWVGPGHGSVVTIDDAMYFVYHAWAANADGTNGPGGRRVLVDKITWGADGWPTIANGSPSTTKQVWPVE